MVISMVNMCLNGLKLNSIIKAHLMNWSPPLFAIPREYSNKHSLSIAQYRKTLRVGEDFAAFEAVFGVAGDKRQFGECAWVCIRVMRTAMLAFRTWTPSKRFGDGPVEASIECPACGSETKDMKDKGCFPARFAFDACYSCMGKVEQGTGAGEEKSSISGVVFSETDKFGDPDEENNPASEPKQAQGRSRAEKLNAARCGNAFYDAILNMDSGSWYRSGIAGLVCVHGICPLLIDLKRGEKYSIPLQAIDHFRSKMPRLKKFRWLFGYDIACLWLRWLNPRRQNGGPREIKEISELVSNITTTTPAFHATTHACLAVLEQFARQNHKRCRFSRFGTNGEILVYVGEGDSQLAALYGRDTAARDTQRSHLLGLWVVRSKYPKSACCSDGESKTIY